MAERKYLDGALLGRTKHKPKIGLALSSGVRRKRNTMPGLQLILQRRSEQRAFHACLNDGTADRKHRRCEVNG